MMARPVCGPDSTTVHTGGMTNGFECGFSLRHQYDATEKMTIP